MGKLVIVTISAGDDDDDEDDVAAVRPARDREDLVAAVIARSRVGHDPCAGGCGEAVAYWVMCAWIRSSRRSVDYGCSLWSICLHPSIMDVLCDRWRCCDHGDEQPHRRRQHARSLLLPPPNNLAAATSHLLLHRPAGGGQ